MTETGEYLFHGLKAFFMLAILFWLIFSTCRLVLLIRKHSDLRNFRSELRNLALVYWFFVLCYVAWQVYFVFDLLLDEHDYQNLGYMHQLLTLAFPFFLFTQVPISLIFLIHFRNHTSIRSLLCPRGANSQRTETGRQYFDMNGDRDTEYGMSPRSNLDTRKSEAINVCDMHVLSE